MLTREQMLAKRDRKPVLLVTEELGEAYIRRFTAQEAAAWSEFSEAACDKDTGKIVYPDLYRAELVRMSLCDADGKATFEATDRKSIADNLSYATLAQIFLESCRVNCLTHADTRMEVERQRSFFLASQPRKTGTGSESLSKSQTSTG